MDCRTACTQAPKVTEVSSRDVVKVLYTKVRCLAKGNIREELKVLIRQHQIDILGLHRLGEEMI